ncbi:hypothetical protein Thimo_2479 [Thioflavicoccus mobilis 8321]|uniref:Uncharacterized protein n=1 Tax=Thioflavicoccus mobilis 8321 TaxID=765912 RepID=L0H0V1_9GAMM|nr:hypothetical protein [Thioflavicoccus mobilis]AGA91209.1 hypothetical protein Thimo_2479 [Thioflavicoccus mobilis 8321]
MTEDHARLARYRDRLVADTQPEMGWAEHLSILLGVCEELQSSRSGLALMDAAVGLEPSLAAVLRPALTDMQQAHQALRQEALGLLERLAARIDDTGTRSGNGPLSANRRTTTRVEVDRATRLFLSLDLGSAPGAMRRH